MVFTRRQWESVHEGEFFPYAGGVISELWHSPYYVFGIYSRYNFDDSVKGWGEAEEIIHRNRPVNSPHVYPD